MTETKARLTLRQGVSTLWASVNPVLLAGEPGFETDTKIMRIGDGATSFTSLPAYKSIDDVAGDFQASSVILAAIAGLTLSANKGIYATDTDELATFDITAAARTFLEKATSADQRTALGLGAVALLAYLKETPVTLTDTTTPALSAASGTLQSWTLTGNSTPTDSLVVGDSITLHVDDGTAAYGITWPAGMKWLGGSAPTLDPTNITVITLWKTSSGLNGQYAGVLS